MNKEIAEIADGYIVRVGDWVFCEFELQIIKQIENNHVTEVSDASFCLSGYNLSDRCFSLTLRNKRISDSFDYYYHKLHDLNRPFNFPGIYNWFVDTWVQACLDLNDEMDYNKKLRNFNGKILHETENLNSKKIENIKIFR